MRPIDGLPAPWHSCAYCDSVLCPQSSAAHRSQLMHGADASKIPSRNVASASVTAPTDLVDGRQSEFTFTSKTPPCVEGRGKACRLPSRRVLPYGDRPRTRAALLPDPWHFPDFLCINAICRSDAHYRTPPLVAVARPPQVNMGQASQTPQFITSPHRCYGPCICAPTGSDSIIPLL